MLRDVYAASRLRGERGVERLEVAFMDHDPDTAGQGRVGWNVSASGASGDICSEDRIKILTKWVLNLLHDWRLDNKQF